MNEINCIDIMGNLAENVAENSCNIDILIHNQKLLRRNLKVLNFLIAGYTIYKLFKKFVKVKVEVGKNKEAKVKYYDQNGKVIHEEF